MTEYLHLGKTSVGDSTNKSLFVSRLKMNVTVCDSCHKCCITEREETVHGYKEWCQSMLRSFTVQKERTETECSFLGSELCSFQKRLQLHSTNPRLPGITITQNCASENRAFFPLFLFFSANWCQLQDIFPSDRKFWSVASYGSHYYVTW